MSYRIILSPAKNLNLSPAKIEFADRPLWFVKENKEILSVLKTLKQEDIQQLMSISPKIGNDVKAYIDGWDHSFQFAAIEMFSGEAFKGFDVQSLSLDLHQQLDDRLRILSGMYGMLRPLDRVAPYRLEMKTSLQIGSNKHLYAFWGPKMAGILNKECDLLINLASSEYSRSVLPYWKKPVITPHFLESNGGNPKMVMMFAKKARGKMARTLVEYTLENIEDLKAYNKDGYQFNASLSSEYEWYFIR